MFYLIPRNSIDGIPPAASSHEKLFGVKMDSELKFEDHITGLCLKISKKKKKKILFHVIRKIQNTNEGIHRITSQLLSLDMDASFLDIE